MGIVHKDKRKKKTTSKIEKKKWKGKKSTEGPKESNGKQKKKVLEKYKEIEMLVEERILGFIERNKKPFWYGHWWVTIEICFVRETVRQGTLRSFLGNRVVLGL